MRRVLFGCLLLAAACGDNGTLSAPHPVPPSFMGGAGFGDTGGFAGASTGGGLPTGGGPFNRPIVKSDPPPPPISGGTLLVLGSGKTAIVSDPDHDQILVVDIDKPRVSFAIALSPGDEPGRLAEDGVGHVHVVLRGGGALASVDPAAGKVLVRRDVCGAPRGIAYDRKADAMHVACAGGELVTLPAAGGEATRQLELDRDLRDVVVDGDNLWISRFRSAEVLRLDATGHVAERLLPPSLTEGTSSPDQQQTAPLFAPEIAWRMIPAPGGGVLLLHQEAITADIGIGPSGYRSEKGCGGPVETAVTLFRSGEKPRSSDPPFTAPLPVDIATTSDFNAVAIVSAGAIPDLSATPPILLYTSQGLNLTDHPSAADSCGGGATGSPPPGQAVAVAYRGGTLLVQTREPAMLIVDSNAVTLPGASRTDTGYDLFHLATPTGVACASCHPEGHDDGRVWSFTSLGQRRTQSLAGGFLGTEPFQWGGDMQDFSSLAKDIMSSRMEGPLLGDGHVEALASWLDQVAGLKAPLAKDQASVDRGHASFMDPAIGCSGCHAGTKLTNNLSIDLGKGAAFQVPSLIGVGWRAPYMHDGCAPTLADTLGACAGSKHPMATLDANQVADLVAYMETL